MALVRLTRSLVGRDFTREPGDLHECDDATAARMIAAGYAEPVRGETAMVEPPLVAALPRLRARKA